MKKAISIVASAAVAGAVFFSAIGVASAGTEVCIEDSDGIWYCYNGKVIIITPSI